MNNLIEKWKQQDSDLYDTNPFWDPHKDIAIERQINACWPARIIEAKRQGNRQAADYAVCEWRQRYMVLVFDKNGTRAFDAIFETITESSLFIKSIPPGYQHVRRIV